MISTYNPVQIAEFLVIYGKLKQKIRLNQIQTQAYAQYMKTNYPPVAINFQAIWV